MTMSDELLPEFDNEMAKTRTTLERVPDGKFDWIPHGKSPSLGWLAGHLAQIPGWAVNVINEVSLDIAPPGAPHPPRALPRSRKELLEVFDNNVECARGVIVGAADAHLREGWTLRAAGKEVFTLPRVAVLRAMVMNHMIHHRAQLGVYLRLNDIAVPAIYGPSADEQGM